MNNDIIWADVVGYEGIYEVSNNGLVRTKEGKTTYTELHGTRVWKQRTLAQRADHENSCRVNLWIDGKPKTHLVHRLVAEAFITKVEDKNYINHKDGSRLNNHVDNLEWCNHSENQNHAYETGLSPLNHNIKLVNENGEEFLFVSKSKASQFLGKKNGFISLRLKRGNLKVDGYLIVEIDNNINAKTL